MYSGEFSFLFLQLGYSETFCILAPKALFDFCVSGEKQKFAFQAEVSPSSSSSATKGFQFGRCNAGCLNGWEWSQTKTSRCDVSDHGAVLFRNRLLLRSPKEHKIWFARETLVPWIVHLLALLEDLGVVPSVSKCFSVISGIDAVYWVAHRSDQYQRKSV